MNLSKKIEDKRKAKQRAEKVKKAKIATAGVVLGSCYWCSEWSTFGS
ncbi:hypothetical protein RHG52_19525 [Clostridioides difficile]|nr:hypothetical protein [Clostridioides difficile]